MSCVFFFLKKIQKKVAYNLPFLIQYSLCLLDGDKYDYSGLPRQDRLYSPCNWSWNGAIREMLLGVFHDARITD